MRKACDDTWGSKSDQGQSLRALEHRREALKNHGLLISIRTLHVDANDR